MVITHRKLPPMQCYHIFSDTRDVYLSKNHCGSYSPQMVPVAEISGSGSWPIPPEKKSQCRLEQPSQTCMNDDDNDEPIVGVVAFAKSCSIENIEAVLDIADTCTRPWAKDPKQLA